MSEDIWENAGPEIDAWLEHCRTELIPMIADSAFSIQIASSEPDPKIAVELGYMILLDKPLIVVVPEGVEISKHLLKAADYVMPFNTDSATFVIALTEALAFLQEQGLLPRQEE